jgi:hypothetical protein
MSSLQAKKMQEELEMFVKNYNPEPACFYAQRQDLPTLY